MPIAMFAITAVTPFALFERLPDPVAVHFTDGEPDASAPLQPTVLEMLLLGAIAWLVMAAIAWLRPAGSIGYRLAAGAAVGVTVTICLTVLLGLVAANLDAVTWRQASTTTAAQAVTLLSGAAGFLLAAVVVHPRRRPRQDPQAPPDWMRADPPPASDERTVWMGRSRNVPLVRKTWGASILMIGLSVLGMEWMLIPALVSFATLHLWGGVIAVFDGTQLVVRGYLPLSPLRRLPLGRIETAEAMRVDPRNWGGWGWRLRSVRSHAIVVREGEALLVALRDGGELIVTVNDAATGAEEIRKALRGETHQLVPPSGG
ncbi:hypothetical protein [Sphaerisporangium dianthi]|uniref:DUF1648 domain-containing protein n=1 Tax=Sphaerisporangium dianthi TaxID=1436120 RepID=A0ABV9CT24_9ACTN